tara:strand:- start:84 stop:488 length:405 start_codon:yes stop_codon:yes gene_type:complete
MPTFEIGENDVIVKRSGAWVHVAGEVGIDVNSDVNPTETYNFVVYIGDIVAVDNKPCVTVFPTQFRSQNISHIKVRANPTGSTVAGSILTISADIEMNGATGSIAYGVGFTAAIAIKETEIIAQPMLVSKQKEV